MEGLDWNGGIGTLLLPVAVPPIGRTPPGLPVGVQVVAPHLHDRTAVAVAGILERLLGGFVPPPALADRDPARESGHADGTAESVRAGAAALRARPPESRRSRRCACEHVNKRR